MTRIAIRLIAIYLRISKAKDGTTLSVDNQLPPCQELARRKFEGWQIDLRPYDEGGTLYIDNDITGTGTRVRPAFEQLLQDARDGKIQAIVAWDVDRLSRDPDTDNARIIELAERYGVQLATVTGEYNLSTSSGRLHFRIKGAIARSEVEHRSERTKLALDQLAAAGKWLGGKRPFGYVIVGTKRHGKREDCTGTDDDRCRLFDCHLEEHPTEAEEIRAAARRVIEGAGGEHLPGKSFSGSITPIAQRWMSLGLRGMTMTTHVRTILTHPRLAGLQRAQLKDEAGNLLFDEDGKPITGLVKATWPAIITRAEHEQLVSILQAPRNSTERQPRKYLLSGWAHHAEPCPRCDGRPCGAKLHTRPNRHNRRQYICDPARGGCGHLWTTAQPIEDEVRDRVLWALSDPEMRAAFERYHARRLSAAAAAELRDRLAADKAKLAQLELLAEDLGQAAVDVRAKIEHRIRTAKARLQAGVQSDALAHLPKDEAGLRAHWDAADLHQRRGVLALVLRRVNLIAPGRGHRVFDPDRVKCDWLV
jgi:DNA invertase Pin-like site-specific DNA recombinase